MDLQNSDCEPRPGVDVVLHPRKGSAPRSGVGRVCAVLLVSVLALPMTADAQRLFEAVETSDATEEEFRTFRVLVRELSFTDVARTWVETRLKRVSSSSRPDIEWLLVDILEAEGKLDEANALNQQLAEQYPTHPRAKAAELESVQNAMLKVRQLSLQAQFETSRTERQKLIQQRDTMFRTEVTGVLDSTIARMNKELGELEEDEEKAALRDSWEFFRLDAYFQYAELFPEGSPVSLEYNQKLLDAAVQFVDQRFNNTLLQYRALLHQGRAEGALGRAEDAAWNFELISGFEPPGAPPFKPEVVRVTRWLRLQGLQGAMQAWNAVGQSDRAVQVYTERPISEHFPWRAEPEDLDLMAFVVALDIEVAIANLAGGDQQVGRDAFRTMIDKFQSESYRAGDPDGADAYLIEIGTGLARAVRVGATHLPAEFLQRAAVGFKRRGDFDRAIRAAQLALDRGSGIPGDEYWLASSLYEIGDCYDSLGWSEAAAAAYQALTLQFKSKKRDKKFETLLADAAQNWFAIAGDLSSSVGGPWVDIAKLAQETFAELSRGEAGYTLQMEEARKKEDIAQYAEARRIYEGIPFEIDLDGETVKLGMYFRARAGAGRCLFLSANSQGNGAAVADEALAFLQSALDHAQRDGNVGGQAILRYEMARILSNPDVGRVDDALEALQPLVSTVGGDNAYREIALKLLIDLCNKTDPARPELGVRPQLAMPALEAMKTSFSESRQLLAALYETADAYTKVGTQEAAERAARLLQDYRKHPESNADEHGPGVKLGYAQILMEGGLHREAKEILDPVAEEVADRPEFAYLVVFLAVKSANLTGEYGDALRLCKDFEEKYGDDLLQGNFQEAPGILFQYALAHLGVRQTDRDDEHLVEADTYLQTAYAIYRQRLQSLATGVELPAELEKERWSVFVTWLEVLVQQQRYDFACRVIKSEETISGREKFAPPAYQQKIDQIKKDACQ